VIKFADLYSQYQSIKPEIDAAIAAVIRDAAFISGRYARVFEGEFSAFLGGSHCVGVGNGTDAIEIAIEALDLPANSEIIVPANTFIASSEAVTRSGHRVVFADVDPGCYTITADAVLRKLSQRTSAVMAVHLYGHPCDMDALNDVAARHGLQIIEDCAQAHGAKYKDRQVGTIGRVATFSFYPGKNLGAFGDAGAIATLDADLAAQARKIANHGRIGKYDHDFEGRNSRLDGLQAAVLSAKLPFLTKWTGRRVEIAERYIEGLRGIGDLILPVRMPWAHQVYHLFVVRTHRRDALKEYLAARGIECGVHYPIALPRLAAYEYLGQANEAMFANEAAGSLLSLPIGEHLSDVDIDEVIDAISHFFA
jgi:dTDP-4-amino-4,6-dideoxygalactose transaminase